MKKNRKTDSKNWGGKRSGAGRKSGYKEPTERVFVTLPKSLNEAVYNYACKNGISFSQAVVEILKKSRTLKEAPPKRG